MSLGRGVDFEVSKLHAIPRFTSLPQACGPDGHICLLAAMLLP